MKKRILSSILAVLTTFSMTAFASDEIVKTEVAVSDSLYGIFTVTETADDYILGTTEEKTQVQFNISEDTVLIDSVSKNAISANDIKAGEKISVDYSSIMTHSLPPQTHANLIATNTEKGGLLNLTYVSKAEKNEKGDLVITDDTTNTVITVSKDASYRPYKTKNIVRADDVKPGTVAVLWYDAVTLSIPAQAYTENVVIVSTPDESGDFTLTVDGKELQTENKPYYEDKTLMVPLRAISEGLGYTVSWDDETQTITVEDAQIQKATLYPDKDEVSFTGKLRIIDMSRTVKNEKETKVIDGHTFVPLEFFKEFSNETKITGNNVTVSPIIFETNGK